MVRVTEVVYTKQHHKHKKIPKLISKLAMFKAAKHNNIEGVKFLLEHDTYSPFIDQPILNWAVLSAHYPIVLLLLQKGANPNILNSLLRTPLHLAADYGSIKIIKALLKGGALVNVQDGRGFTPLHTAIKSKLNYKFKVIKLFVRT